MHKLLSLVLSVSILVSSVSPALGQAVLGRGAVRGMRNISAATVRGGVSSLSVNVSRRVLTQTALANSTLQARILAGQTAGLAQHILTRPTVERAALLRNDFVALSLVSQAVSPSQRLEASALYAKQLSQAHAHLNVSQSSLDKFLTVAQQNPTFKEVQDAYNVLADASALGLVGTREQAPILLDFYKQAQGTLFEDTAALITARGLLRMQAYDELGQLLASSADKPALAGVATYVKEHKLPVAVPESLNGLAVPAEQENMAQFLGANFLPNRLHADASMRATELWMQMHIPQAPSISAAKTNTVATKPQSTIEKDAPAEQSSLDVENIHFVPPTPGGFVQPVQMYKTTATPAVSKPETVPAETVASSAPRGVGILYSGIPIFAISDAVQKRLAWLRKKFSQEKQVKAPYEEPGLHDSSVLPIYEVADTPDEAQVGGDLVGAHGNIEMVPVGADGFKLTVEGPDKVEHILHNVDLTVSSSLKNFSSEYNRLALDTNHIFELRNQKIKAKRPDHFYFLLSTTNGEFDLLIQGAKALNLPRSMRIKIQRTSTPKKSITLPVVDANLNATSLVADVDASLLGDIKTTEGGQVVSRGQALYFRSAQGELTPLENAFVRLPKAESKYWTKILAMYPAQPFNLGVFSTMDKMPPVTYLVPSLQIGLGKTLAPVLEDMSTLGDTASSAIMLSINNVLPALMGFVHPMLKKYGEAAVFRTGASMFTLGGLVALASGLYGHVGTDIMSSWQLAGFLTSSILIALGTNITRFVQNIIISANRGIVPQANSFKKKAPTLQQQPVTYNAAFLAKRAKEVLTKKSTESLRDVVYYQRGAMFKNLGTMVFLSFPWLANMAGKSLGYDLGLDFSASYVPYTLYSLYTLHKLNQVRYKDAFPLDLTVLTSNLQDMKSIVSAKISAIDPAQLSAQHPVMQEAAKQLKGTIDALVPVEARKTKKAANGLTAKYETQSGEELEKYLIQKGQTAQQAQAARQALQQAFDTLGHRHVKLTDVMLMAGLPSSLAAMTLATLGELGLSNGLAFAMRELVGNGTAATGIVGILLYGCMFGWRIVGNILSQRMSGGSMYALSSAAAVAGPMMMALANGRATPLVTGAIIACFGISNFFSQMYEYMIGLHPKYKREIALLINYTMPVAAVGASLLRLTSGVAGLDMGLAGAALAASVALTPGMLANSSVLRMIQYEWGKAKTAIKNLLKRGGDQPPLAQGTAQ